MSTCTHLSNVHIYTGGYSNPGNHPDDDITNTQKKRKANDTGYRNDTLVITSHIFR